MDLMRAAPPSSRQRADPGIRLEPRQRSELRALPGLLRSLRLLPLGHEALLGAVERALDDNPMLERLPGSVCAVCGRHQVSERCPRCRGLVRAPDTTPSVLPFETLEAAAGCEIRSDCREVLPVVIAHLTPRGLLDAEPGEIAAEHGLAPASVAEAVRAIKAVGPPGVAETSVTDLLLVQARLLVDAGAAAPWFAEVVREHLQEVATGNTVAVAAAVGVPEEEVAAAFRLIRARLRPLASVETRPRAEVPAGVDVFVYRSRSGVLEVEVPDSRWFGLGLASVPPRIRADAEAATWLADQERAARELMHQLDIRGGVLRRVAAYVVERQSGYFDRGAAGHVPLTRTEVAAALGLHPSTVSRCVAGKALRCPNGDVVALADLLGGAVALKARLAELATANRWSDTRLVQALADSGHRVARRTVAKYRAELGIAAGGLRRI